MRADYQRWSDLSPKSDRLEAWGRKGLLKSGRRRRLPLNVRRSIRARAGGRCEDCGRPLKAVLETEYPEQWTDREILDVYHDYPCHRCEFRFPVVDAGFSRTMIWASGFKNTSQRSTGTTRIRSGSPTGPITAPRVGPFKGVTGSKRQSSNVSQMTCLPSPLGALIRLRNGL